MRGYPGWSWSLALLFLLPYTALIGAGAAGFRLAFTMPAAVRIVIGPLQILAAIAVFLLGTQGRQPVAALQRLPVARRPRLVLATQFLLFALLLACAVLRLG